MPINMLSGAESQYAVFDGLGRLWGTVSDNGQVTSKYEYDPYQQLISLTYPNRSAPGVSAAKAATSQMQPSAGMSGASGGTPWATFGVQDEVVKGYWKRGARWHDTATGSWTSVDPITRLADPSRANPYIYAGADPVNQFDPAGRMSIDISAEICVGACVKAGVSVNDDGSVHPHVGTGVGGGGGVTVSGSSADAEPGMDSSGECHLGPVGMTNNGDVNVSGSTDVGCSAETTYTW